MKTKLLLITVLALATGMAGVYAEEEVAAATEESGEGVGAAALITLEATVTAVNQEAREVTLKGPEGNEVTLTVGEEVKNLPQVEVGDQVTAAYYESVTIRRMEPGEAEPEVEMAAMGTAEPGEKPAMIEAEKLNLVATVEAIDKANETVTLKGPEGNSKTVKVQNPANLEKVAVGDRLLFTYTTGIAVDVSEKASAPAE